MANKEKSPSRALSMADVAGVSREEFFANAVATTGGCIVWRGTRNAAQYGVFTLPGVGRVAAHRVAHALINGDIPEGFVVRHACDNPPCVNPNHLSIGTPWHNTRDASERGRLFWFSRSRDGLREAVMLVLLDAGWPVEKIARFFRIELRRLPAFREFLTVLAIRGGEMEYGDKVSLTRRARFTVPEAKP